MIFSSAPAALRTASRLGSLGGAGRRIGDRKANAVGKLVKGKCKPRYGQGAAEMSAVSCR
jgi:hypothetical protein